MQTSTLKVFVAAAFLSMMASTAAQSPIPAHLLRMCVPEREDAPLKTSPSSATTAEILMKETFTGMDFVSDPDTPLARQPQIEIAPEYTDTPGLFGHCVYGADGAVLLFNGDYQSYSWITTPYGDWSGRITVTLKARALPCGVTGSLLKISPMVGSLDKRTAADANSSTDDSSRSMLYPYMGWCRVSCTFDNYSADADGYIMLLVNGKVEIDDVEITAESPFIATPHVTACRDFTDTSFTIDWDPLRMTYNYYVDLWEKRVESDEPTQLNVDFDFKGLSDRFSVDADPVEYSENKGRDNTKGLILRNGETLQFTNGVSAMRNIGMYVNVMASSDDYEYHDFTDMGLGYILSMDGYLKVEVLDAEGNWIYYGTDNLKEFLADMSAYHGLEEGDNSYHWYDMDKLAGNLFSGKYFGIRFSPQSLPKSAYVVIDDITVTGDPEAKLYRAEGSEMTEADEDHNCYVILDRGVNTFTFTGLDPDGDYYYGVRGHYVMTFSESVPLQAFGVGVPQLDNPTGIDISQGAFSVEWSQPKRATSYELQLFGVQDAQTPGWYTVMKETFSKVHSASTEPYNPEQLGSYDYMSLDGYTDVPGWECSNTHICEGMAGPGDYVGWVNCMATPEMNLSHSKTVRVEMKIFGSAGDRIIIEDEVGTQWALPMSTVEGKGEISGYADLEFTPGADKHFLLFSENYAAFVIDEISFSQYVDQPGRHVYSPLDVVKTDNANTSFTDLNDAYGYDIYGLRIRAIAEKDGKSAWSNYSTMQETNLATGETSQWVNPELETGLGMNIEPVSEAVEVARYSIEGHLLPAPRSGLNIVVYSDGTRRKEIVK